MTPLQTALYFREWGKVRAHYVAQGIDPKLADAKRHELHKRALGAVKSSKLFTNADLDRVLGVFRAITRPADLQAQLDAIEQPEIRHRNVMRRARDLASRVVDTAGREGVYLDSMARKIFGVDHYEKLSETQLQTLCGVLNQRIDQLTRAAAKQRVGALREVAAQAAGRAVPAGEAEVPGNENPF